MEASKDVAGIKEDDDEEDLATRGTDNPPVVKKSAKDFKFIGLIGEGSFSVVSLDW